MWKQLHQKQNGQIVVVVPIALLAFVGMVALVVNVGIFKLIRSEMQNAADAAALAAVWYDPFCPVSDPRCFDAGDNARMKAAAAADVPPYAAYRVARDYAAKYNGQFTKILCGTQPDVRPHGTTLSSPNVQAISVVITCNAGVVGGGVLGIAPIQIWAASTAAIGIRTPNGDITSWAATGAIAGRLVP